MKNNIFYQHGWGFDRNCWNKLLLSDKGSNPICADRGYFSSSRVEVVLPADGIHTVVCHSLGLHLAPVRFISKCRLLVLINCFHGFHGKTEREGRRSRVHVRNMLQELNDNPKDLLEKFHKNCESSFPIPEEEHMNKKLLFDDLQFLDTNIFDLAAISHIPHVLIIHGAKDRIVPVQRSRDIRSNLQNASYVEIENGGHGLPFTHPEMCRSLIQERITNSP